MFYNILNVGLEFVFLTFVFGFVWLIWANVSSVPFAIALTLTFGLLAISGWILSLMLCSYFFREEETIDVV
ncbi:hypothetical protein GMAR_ORF13 [Golden Marseillevirus]|uniref:hypothetical protein n=1 Tax=Golden Marseillevirus TaxID=1720526 RepID=UPI000877AEC9|nr:hypothetical protein GMAR_ORF13 [Golden Marseillevirus]ALX27388.1 hypothetical protein GMAR_ORF13 [Golden Marseillevirus]